MQLETGVRPFNEIAKLIEPTLQSMGFELVRVRLFGGGQPRLQVMAEPADPKRAMTVDDCAEISHAISAVLDVADPIAGSYILEVSSPGIDRPLVRLGDFSRFAGYEARVETREPIEGRRRFRGLLRGVRGEDVLLAVDGEEIVIPFAAIQRAKLVLTEALLAAAQRQSEE